VCFLFSALAGRAGLAPIVGAFAAGLMIEEGEPVHSGPSRASGVGLVARVERIASFLVPVFFVLMGTRVDLASVAVPGIAGFAAALLLVAVAGKLACALVVSGRVDRLAVGLGMIPRGEVGLIFAGIGSTLAIRGARVIEPSVYAAVVAMVAVTTLITPPLLAWRLGRRS
jgi:Kef-type K+ transport system membrane component KefB